MPKAKTSGGVSLAGGLLLVLVCLLWGANAVSIKISNQGIPSLLAAAARSPVVALSSTPSLLPGHPNCRPVIGSMT